jgi:hypothetical protein
VKLDAVRDLMEEQKDLIKKLKTRAEFIMMELRRKVRFHVDAGGVWQGEWLPHFSEEEAATTGLQPLRFIRRWTCCDCTNKFSLFCKPFCGCGEITEHFCSQAPVPPPDSTAHLHPVIAAKITGSPHPLYHKTRVRDPFKLVDDSEDSVGEYDD